MDKKEARKIIVESSKVYKEELLGKNILFVYKEKSGKLSSVGTNFLPRNFLHLTGIKLNEDGRIKSSVHFLDICVRNQLSVKDFEFAEDGTTLHKLDVLPLGMQIHKTARMLGDYNNTGTFKY